MVDNIFTTERLEVRPIAVSDAAFMLHLMNTPGWLEFIGDRKIVNLAGSTKYIESFADNPNAFFWVVFEKVSSNPIGVVSLIQRTYLPFRDIGFAFLPEYGKKGYAFEAVNSVYENIKTEVDHVEMLATTLPSNVNSRRLLERLGLAYVKDIEADNENLMLYSSVVPE